MNKKMKSDKKQNKEKLWLGTALLRDHNYIYLSDLFKAVPSGPTGSCLRRQPVSV